MRNLFRVITILFPCILTFAQDNPDMVQIATMKNREYIFIVDTNAIKKDVSHKLIQNASTLNFDKIEIVKKPIIGKSNDSIYSLRISCTEKKASISRCLIRINQSLFFDNSSKRATSFNLIYQICLPNENSNERCEPNVFDYDGIFTWICGTDTNCVLPGFELKCKSFSSVLLPD